MQMFVPRSRIGIFGNECTWSAPLDPKLMFCWVSYCLGAFGTDSSPYKTQLKTRRTGAINAKVRAMKSRRNFWQRSHPMHPHWTLNSCYSVFRTVWVHLEPFRRLMKLSSKWAELVRLMQKFMPRSRVGIFHNECTWFTSLDPKLMFWCVLYCLGAFGTVSSPYDTRFKTGWTGAINAKVHATKSC